MKIILFGDSLFAEIGKHRLESLESKIPGADVYNCAVGGWDSDDCVAKGPYIASLKPDTLLLSVGTNDASPWKLVDLNKFEENLKQIFKIFSESKIVYFLPPPVNTEKMSAEKRGLNNRILKTYYEIGQKISEESEVLTIDSWRIFESILNKDDSYHTDDGVHLKDSAYKLIFQETAKLLR